jgi:hypothetical protein
MVKPKSRGGFITISQGMWARAPDYGSCRLSERSWANVEIAWFVR